MASKGKLRCGVVGTGMGRYHMEGFASHPKSELVAVCDLNFDEAKQFADEYGAKHVFRDFGDMIAMDGLDAVAIAVPNYLHARMTIAALKAGKDVLCEKPMATALADAEAMVAEAKKAKKRLMIHMAMRFEGMQQDLRQRIDRGQLGKVYYAKSQWIRRKGIPLVDFPRTGSMGRGEWFVKKKLSGGGATVDIGVHMFDLVWWLIGSPKPVSVLAAQYMELLPKRVAKVGVKGDVDDLASAFVRFSTGQAMFFEVSWDAHQAPFLGYQVFGTQAGARWGDWKDTYTLYSDDKKGKPAEKAIKPKGSAKSGYWHFVDCCLDRNAKMMASGGECLNVMRVLDAIGRSQKTGKAITL
jgi:predicted dehydrogenase